MVFLGAEFRCGGAAAVCRGEQLHLEADLQAPSDGPAGPWCWGLKADLYVLLIRTCLFSPQSQEGAGNWHPGSWFSLLVLVKLSARKGSSQHGSWLRYEEIPRMLLQTLCLCSASRAGAARAAELRHCLWPRHLGGACSQGTCFRTGSPAAMVTGACVDRSTQ